MKAFIFSAGIGKRLRPLTNDLPKCLIKVNEKTIAEYQIESLEHFGIRDIYFITGHCKEKVKDHLGDSVTYIFNPHFKAMNNISSQWISGDFMKGDDCLCLHGDVIVHNKILEDILKSSADVSLSIQQDCDEDMIRVRVKNGLVTQITKPIPYREAYGNFIGIVKYSKESVQSISQETEKFIRNGKTDVYFTEPLNELIKRGLRVLPVPTKNLPWFEIDTMKDLEYARRNIPLIYRKF